MESSTESLETSAGADAVIAPDAEVARLALKRKLQRQSDLGLLAISAAVVVASVLLTPSTEAVALFGWEVPPLCLFSTVFGTDCFGCGMTRSFTYVGHGQFTEALELHKLGPALYLLVCAQLPLRSWRLWRTRHPIETGAARH